MSLFVNKFRIFLSAIFTFCFLSNFSQHYRITDSLQELVKHEMPDTSKVKLLNDIGGYFISYLEYSKALLFLNEGRDLALQINDVNGITVAYNRLGILYTSRNNFTQARENLNEALISANKSGNKKDLADVLSNLAVVNSHRSEYALALEKNLKALKIRQEIGDASQVAASYMSIANLYYLEERYDMTIVFYNKVLETKNIEKYPHLYSKALYNTGLMYHQMLDVENALKFYDRALKINTELNDQQGIALVYSAKARELLAKKKYSDAQLSSLKGIEILEKLEDKRSLAEALSTLGAIHDSLREPEKALECYRRQLSLAREIGSKTNASRAYENFAKHYAGSKDFKKAYEYYTIYKRNEDSVKMDANSRALSELEANYETEKKENEIQLLRSEQSLQATKSSHQRQLIITVSLLFIMLGIVGFLYNNRSQLKKRNQLEKNIFELERNALSLQMNPHFIFNSLGSISGFVAENDKEKATEYLAVFSRLIRHNLEQSREKEVSIMNEAKMLSSYLTLEQLRFNSIFDFEVSIGNEMDQSLMIPPMFIQPFVENAVLHGVVPKNSKGMIRIRFFKEKENEFICTIDDNGIGRKEAEKRREGSESGHRSLATTITKERMSIINSLNENKISIETLDLTDSEGNASGTLVKIIFPEEFI
jgi:tetratricopeptide (TPR) repeat protein